MAPEEFADAECRLMARTCACYHLRRAARNVTRRYDAALASVGLKATQLTILSAVNLCKGMNLSSLADVLAIEQSALSRNVALLKRRRLLRAAPCENRREQLLELTAEGREKLMSGHEVWRGVQQELEAQLESQELRAALKLLRRMSDGSPSLAVADHR